MQEIILTIYYVIELVLFLFYYCRYYDSQFRFCGVNVSTEKWIRPWYICFEQFWGADLYVNLFEYRRIFFEHCLD